MARPNVVKLLGVDSKNGEIIAVYISHELSGYKGKFVPDRPHGEWIWKEYDPDYDCGDIVCSKCSVVIYEGVPQVRLKAAKWPFCPDCGADMREGDSDA